MTEATQPHSTRRALAAIGADLWGIRPEALEQIVAIASREHLPDLEAAAQRREQIARNPGDQVPATVAVIDVHGVIFPRANMITEYSGGTSLAVAAAELQRALDDPRVSAIVLHVDSPGGQVSGVADFGKAIARADGVKPVFAFVSHLAASAAYWVGSAARHVAVSSTSVVGALGVVMQAEISDDPKRVRFVSSQTPGKVPDPATDKGKASIQRMVDDMAAVFLADVARNRGTTVAQILQASGQGGVLVGAGAVAAGLADSVSTFAELLAAIGAGRAPGMSRAVFDSRFSAAVSAALDDTPAGSPADDPPAAATSDVWAAAAAKVNEPGGKVIHQYRSK